MWEQTVLSHFFSKLFEIGHVTRIDLAVDDMGCNYYSIDEIIDRQESGRVLSKWRSVRKISKNAVSDNEKLGQTVYFGSPQSEIMLRIYDKKLEQNTGLKEDDENYIQQEWIRWELELKRERADEAARLLSSGVSLGNVAVGVLSYYFRIIELDDTNRSRCSSEDKWELFVDNVKSLRITVEKELKSLEEERKQWEYQNGRKVAKMFYYMDGNSDYFSELASRYECKLTRHDLVQLNILEKESCNV